ncbi:type IV pili methyl-accepting chemotaxis transducer N-terminal domain-containing protein [Ramlibacter sp. PS4R-6]|uniref:type IV pili methyl-accepting chemotaxis transducer N-terminal domain-containing protein n=1 Tax=Ramlibacter sp. PS4R-6 TaxID=3133438 RepID=UPI00309F955A
MTTVLLIQPTQGPLPSLAADCAAAGFGVLGPVECADMVRDALRNDPDVVLCWQPRADAAFLDALRTLRAQRPLPVAVFTQDADAQWMNDALEAGADAWVVQGYAPQRLRPLVQLAQARHARERKLREELAEVGARLEERKLVDKAKGILMRSRQMSEDEAFQLLRTASMQGKQRVGQVSQHVIDAALAAGAINRAGQQRMLSQRLVKLYALACSGTEAASAALLMKQSVARVDENLAHLDKALSAATYGDLLAAARTGWAPLKKMLSAAPAAAQLPDLDARAEAMLQQADALVAALEASGLAATAGVVNVSGRQRMLSQRFAKCALLGSSEGARAAAAAFEEGMAALAEAPLTSTQIRQGMGDAREAWVRLQEGVRQAGQPAGRLAIASASEELLALFDQLTEAYEHSLQVLLG